GKRASEIDMRMRRHADRIGFNVLGFVAREGEAVRVRPESLVDPKGPLVDWALHRQVDEIVVGVDDRRGGLPMRDLLECRQNGIDVTDLATFFERESGRVQLSLTDPSWLVFSSGFDTTPLRRFSKRCSDLLIAILVLSLTWPLMLL